MFLQTTGLGFGWTAFAGLSHLWAAAPRTDASNATPRVKSVVFLFMDGGVSHVDSFDYKPELAKRSGQPADWTPDARSQAVGQGRKWLGALWPFAQRGDSGLWVSDLFPHTADVIDELCVVRSLTGATPLHGQQNLLLHTGRAIGAGPSLGAWIVYGLGSENENLPGYVLLNNDWTPNGGAQNFGSGFLPATCQASTVRPSGQPMDNIAPSDPLAVQQAKLDYLARQNSAAAALRGDASAIEAAIGTYATAARMQSALPAICDVSDETAATRAL
jgi:hypothetical protein